MVTGSFLCIFVILAGDAQVIGLRQILIALALKQALISTLHICDGSEDAGVFPICRELCAHSMIIVATLAGPVLAVQAQKFVERTTESRR